MWHFVSNLFANDFLPLGRSFVEHPWLLRVYVVSDLLIAISLFAIGLNLLYALSILKEAAFRRAAMMSSVFMFLGGTTYLAQMWTIWDGVFPLATVMKLLTASAALIVVYLLRPFAQVVAGLGRLESAKFGHTQRQKMPYSLQAVRRNLEMRVQERTKDLEQSNKILREKTKTLERFTKVTQDRELEMARLKNEIDALLDDLRRPRRYHTPEQPLTKIRIGESA